MSLPRCIRAAFRLSAKYRSIDILPPVAGRSTSASGRLCGNPFLAGLAVVFLLLGAKGHSRQGAAGGELHIAAVQAKLFFSQTGTFSEDVLANPDFALWNTPVGEGSAEAPSNSTFIVVVIEVGAPRTEEHKRRLHFTASYKYGSVTESNAIKVENIQIQQTRAIGSFGKDGRSYVGFWLHDTGCEPVNLTAEITGQAPVKVVKKRIDFKCGE